jgi:transcription initiation factor TFIID TATA-box-binding protein
MKSGFKVKIENVVASTVLGKNIPLNRLVAKAEKAEYEPEKFPGLVYRIDEPRAAALIFSTGKVVCTGTKTVKDAKSAIKKVIKMLGGAGVAMPMRYEVHVENIVAATMIDTQLKLGEITFLLKNSEYEPEKFPGLVYRIEKPRATFLLFDSGKIICKDVRTETDIHAALIKLKKNLEAIGIKVKPVAE